MARSVGDVSLSHPPARSSHPPHAGLVMLCQHPLGVQVCSVLGASCSYSLRTGWSCIAAPPYSAWWLGFYLLLLLCIFSQPPCCAPKTHPLPHANTSTKTLSGWQKVKRGVWVLGSLFKLTPTVATCLAEAYGCIGIAPDQSSNGSLASEINTFINIFMWQYSIFTWQMLTLWFFSCICS